MNTFVEYDGTIQRIYETRGANKHFETERAHIEFVQTKAFGEALYIDGVLQCTKNDEYIYHEMLVHPAMQFMPLNNNNKNNKVTACVLGGADGCATREILKYENVERIDLFDWDKELVEHFKTTKSDWNRDSLINPKVHIQTVDVRTVLHDNTKHYDFIFIDLLDPDCNQKDDVLLFKSILKSAIQWKNPDGCIVINAGGVNPFKTHTIEWLTREIQCIYEEMNIYPFVDLSCYKAFVPSFAEEWAFMMLYPLTVNKNPILSNLRHYHNDFQISYEQWSKEYMGFIPDGLIKIDPKKHISDPLVKMSLYKSYRLELLPTEEGKAYYIKNEDRNNDNAGYDLYVCKEEIITGSPKLVDLGVKARMVCIETGEEVHYCLTPRSSIYKSNVFQVNSNGIIDRSYRGKIMAPLYRLSGVEPIVIKEGMRLFQIIAPDMDWIKEIRIVDSLPETKRGELGFGSSGLF